MELAFKKEKGDLIAAAHCEGECGLWIQQVMPIPGAIGLAAKLLPSGEWAKVNTEGGFFRGCKDESKCPNRKVDPAQISLPVIAETNNGDK